MTNQAAMAGRGFNGGGWVSSNGARATLLAKEARLLLPAYGAALLLALLPGFTGPLHRTDPNRQVMAEPLLFLAHFGFFGGLLLVSVSSFGREFNLRTFPSLLAQPSERSRIWWMKILTLVLAFGSLSGIWWLSCRFSGETADAHWTDRVIFTAAVVASLFSSGLWITLLTRQITAALWLSILISTGVWMAFASDAASRVALSLYAAAGFFFAWRLFMQAQEVGWSGGTVALPGWRSRERTQPAIRLRQPWHALLRKELKLQQISIIGIGVMLLLHLATILAQTRFSNWFSTAQIELFKMFPVFWAVAPVLIGCNSVAEERKSGTLAGNLTLPMSTRAQYFVKCFTVILLGGVLPGLLFAGVSYLGACLSGGPQDWAAFVVMLWPMIPFLITALVCFYASTMAGSLVQALAIAAAVGALLLGTMGVMAAESNFSDMFLLIGMVAIPIAAVMVITWQGARNVRTIAEDWGLWLRNFAVFACTFPVAIALSLGIHHRLWELVMTVDATHGPPLLASAKIFNASPLVQPEGLVALLPDGRVFDGVFTGVNTTNVYSSYPSYASPVKAPNSWQGVPGTNWVGGTLTINGLAGIHADGTLWASYFPEWTFGSTGQAGFSNYHQIGTDNDWVSIVRAGQAAQWLFLLKRNGTLWYWTPGGTQQNGWSTEPHQLEASTNWIRLESDEAMTFAWQQSSNGTRAFFCFGGLTDARTGHPFFEPAPAFDNFSKVRSITHLSGLNYVAAVKDDGTLWAWQFRGTRKGNVLNYSEPRQLGNDTNWMSVTCNGRILAGLRTDGTFWVWPPNVSFMIGRNRDLHPVQFGAQHDWIAISSVDNQFVVLAADGKLWSWWDRQSSPHYSSEKILAPSRRPTMIADLFASPK